MEKVEEHVNGRDKALLGLVEGLHFSQSGTWADMLPYHHAPPALACQAGCRHSQAWRG